MESFESMEPIANGLDSPLHVNDSQNLSSSSSQLGQLDIESLGEQGSFPTFFSASTVLETAPALPTSALLPSTASSNVVATNARTELVEANAVTTALTTIARDVDGIYNDLTTLRDVHTEIDHRVQLLEEGRDVNKEVLKSIIGFSNELAEKSIQLDMKLNDSFSTVNSIKEKVYHDLHMMNDVMETLDTSTFLTTEHITSLKSDLEKIVGAMNDNIETLATQQAQQGEELASNTSTVINHVISHVNNTGDKLEQQESQQKDAVSSFTMYKNLNFNNVTTSSSSKDNKNVSSTVDISDEEDDEYQYMHNNNNNNNNNTNNTNINSSVDSNSNNKAKNYTSNTIHTIEDSIIKVNTSNSMNTPPMVPKHVPINIASTTTTNNNHTLTQGSPIRQQALYTPATMNNTSMSNHPSPQGPSDVFASLSQNAMQDMQKLHAKQPVPEQPFIPTSPAPPSPMKIQKRYKQNSVSPMTAQFQQAPSFQNLPEPLQANLTRIAREAVAVERKKLQKQYVEQLEKLHTQHKIDAHNHDVEIQQLTTRLEQESKQQRSKAENLLLKSQQEMQLDFQKEIEVKNSQLHQLEQQARTSKEELSHLKVQLSMSLQLKDKEVEQAEEKSRLAEAEVHNLKTEHLKQLHVLDRDRKDWELLHKSELAKVHDVYREEKAKETKLKEELAHSALLREQAFVREADSLKQDRSRQEKIVSDLNKEMEEWKFRVKEEARSFKDISGMKELYSEKEVLNLHQKVQGLTEMQSKQQTQNHALNEELEASKKKTHLYKNEIVLLEAKLLELESYKVHTKTSQEGSFEQLKLKYVNELYNMKQMHEQREQEQQHESRKFQLHAEANIHKVQHGHEEELQRVKSEAKRVVLNLENEKKTLIEEKQQYINNLQQELHHAFTQLDKTKRKEMDEARQLFDQVYADKERALKDQLHQQQLNAASKEKELGDKARTLESNTQLCVQEAEQRWNQIFDSKLRKELASLSAHYELTLQNKESQWKRQIDDDLREKKLIEEKLQYKIVKLEKTQHCQVHKVESEWREKYNKQKECASKEVSRIKAEYLEQQQMKEKLQYTKQEKLATKEEKQFSDTVSEQKVREAALEKAREVYNGKLDVYTDSMRLKYKEKVAAVEEEYKTLLTTERAKHDAVVAKQMLEKDENISQLVLEQKKLQLVLEANQNTIHTYYNDKVTLQSQLQEIEHAYTRLQSELQVERVQLETEKMHLNTLHADLRNTCAKEAALQQDVHSMTSTLKNTYVEMEILSKTVAQHEQTEAALKEELARLQKEYVQDKYTSAMHVVEFDHDVQARQLKEETARALAVQKCESQQEHVKQLLTEKMALKQQLQTTTEKQETVRLELHTTEHKCSTLQHQFETEAQKYTSLSQQHGHITSQLQQVQGQVRQLEGENTKLRSHVETLLVKPAASSFVPRLQPTTMPMPAKPASLQENSLLNVQQQQAQDALTSLKGLIDAFDK